MPRREEAESLMEEKELGPRDRSLKDVEFMRKFGLLSTLLKDRATGKILIWTPGDGDEVAEIKSKDIKKNGPYVAQR